MPLGGVQVGSYEGYEQAQAAVDYLSDEKFPVENVTIIGTDLRQIERVTGRLTQGRAIAAGAAGGAWWGLFVGLLLGIFSTDGGAWIGSVLTGLAIGLVFGAVFGWMGYRATGGRRDFTSTSQIVASRYDVMCSPRAGRGGPGPPGPLLPPRADGQRSVAKAIAAAAATPRESTPARIGIFARTRAPRPAPRA